MPLPSAKNFRRMPAVLEEFFLSFEEQRRKDGVTKRDEDALKKLVEDTKEDEDLEDASRLPSNQT